MTRPSVLGRNLVARATKFLPRTDGRVGRWLGVAGIAVALAATVANWARLWRTDRQPWRGAVRLELRWFRTATVLRFAAGAAAIGVLVAGGPWWLGFVLAAVAEGIGRWLFFVAVVPLNMPGAFWRGAAGSHR